jgi:hypothetical protein
LIEGRGIRLSGIGNETSKSVGIHETYSTIQGFRSKTFTSRLPVSGFIQANGQEEEKLGGGQEISGQIDNLKKT